CLLVSVFSHCARDHRDLHSFPTRRSSDLLARIFQREECRVLVAEGGQAALEACRQHRVDVVLTDLMMPSMSGIDLIRALSTVARSEEHTSELQSRENLVCRLLLEKKKNTE